MEPRPERAREVDLIGRVGYDVEIAREDGYGGFSKNRESKTVYWVKDERLYKERDGSKFVDDNGNWIPVKKYKEL